MVQLLSPEGERIENPDYPLEISDDEIASLYRDMVLVRRIDTEAVALQRQGELGLWASLLGQEGAQIGAGRALRPQDMAFPTYREHGVAWCRGVDALTLLGLFRGTNLGGWNPHDNNFNLYTIVIGAQTLHAAGYAMGVMRDGAVGTGDPDRDTAVLTFFGDGASSQGDVNESFVWAAADNLPDGVLLPEQPVGDLGAGRNARAGCRCSAGRAASASPVCASTATTYSASLAVTRKALDDARSGQGPDPHRGVHLPDERTYHVGRSERAIASPPSWRRWKLRDPDRPRALLPQSAQLDRAGLLRSRRRRIEAMAEHASLGLPLRCQTPIRCRCSIMCYVELTDGAREQRDDFARYLASVGDGSS